MSKYRITIVEVCQSDDPLVADRERQVYSQVIDDLDVAKVIVAANSEPEAKAAMSDTPRTDEEAFPVWNDNKCETEFFVNADYASGLERELAALRADKERLDWLDKAPIVRFIHLSQFCGIRDSARSAIDSAKESKYA